MSEFQNRVKILRDLVVKGFNEEKATEGEALAALGEILMMIVKNKNPGNVPKQCEEIVYFAEQVLDEYKVS